MQLKNFNGDQLRPDWQRHLSQLQLARSDRLLNDALFNHSDEDKVRAWNEWSDAWICASQALSEQENR